MKTYKVVLEITMYDEDPGDDPLCDEYTPGEALKEAVGAPCPDLDVFNLEILKVEEI